MESHHSVTRSEGSIPRIIWKSPPRFNLNKDWGVAAGEESRESEYQKQRELAVREAVYTLKTSIPSSPPPVSVTEVGRRQDDPHEAPLIPVVPVEETNPIIIPVSDKDSPSPVDKPSSLPLPSMEADVPAAASAVLMAILKSNEQGSLIDTNLLIKILSDPKMLEKLTQTQDEVNPPISSKEMPPSPALNSSSSSPSLQTTAHMRTPPPPSATSLQHSNPSPPSHLPLSSSFLFRGAGVPSVQVCESKPRETCSNSSMVCPQREAPNHELPSLRSGPFNEKDVAVIPDIKDRYGVHRNGSFWGESASFSGRPPLPGPSGHVTDVGNGVMPSLSTLPYSFGGGGGTLQFRAPISENKGQSIEKDGIYYKCLVDLHGGEREKKDHDQFVPYFDPKRDLGCHPFQNEIHMTKRWRRSY